jgi:hypothetical protein
VNDPVANFLDVNVVEDAISNPERACGIVYIGSELNARLMTWWRAWHEIFASPRGELIWMANLLGREGVLSLLPSSYSM